MTLSKAQFRENCLKKMKKLPKHNRIYIDYLVNKSLLDQLKKRKNSTILFYYPFGFEVDVRKTIIKMRKKHKVFLPFMVEQSFKMVPFRLPLCKKKFGIYESKNSLRDIKKIDIVIVPVVGIDLNLQRVGFGKGMYDRFFTKLKKRPYTIFIQPEICYTKEKVCDHYDISCDLILSKNKKIKNRKR
jgi:5-formyltetrahydrofolate cyclo-ligase